MTLGQVVNLLKQHWPFSTGRGAVLSGYRTIGIQHKHVLADIALRNYVFADLPAGDAIELAINEGRRRCANEIIALANANHEQVWALIEKKPTERGSDK